MTKNKVPQFWQFWQNRLKSHFEIAMIMGKNHVKFRRDSLKTVGDAFCALSVFTIIYWRYLFICSRNLKYSHDFIIFDIRLINSWINEPEQRRQRALRRRFG